MACSDCLALCGYSLQVEKEIVVLMMLAIWTLTKI